MKKLRAADDLYAAMGEAGIRPDHAASPHSFHWNPVIQPGDVHAGDAAIDVLHRMMVRGMTAAQMADLAQLVRLVARCAREG
jgi:hypothetical protein